VGEDFTNYLGRSGSSLGSAVKIGDADRVSSHEVLLWLLLGLSDFLKILRALST
jgi:hypothetical protein